MMNKLILSLMFFSVLSFDGFAQLDVIKIKALPKTIIETSGLVFYKNKYLVTHNDGGNKSRLFVLDTLGNLVKKIKLVDTKNKDWEDLTQDDKGNLYLGDFGNNYNARKKCQIYIIKKGFIYKDEVEPEKISFWYEDQLNFPPENKNKNFDCEAFFYKDGFLYLLTKCRTTPFTGVSNVYRIPAKKGKHKAKFMGQFQFCNIAWQFCSVTAADYHKESNTLTILTYAKLYVVSNIKNNEFWNGDIKMYNIPKLKQREAITYASPNKWFMTDEFKKGFGGGNLYTVEIKKKKKRVY
jgi:hypothetical protein